MNDSIDNHILKIDSVDWKNAGMYRCSVEYQLINANKTRFHVSENVRMTITKPPVVEIKYNNDTVSDGATVKLHLSNHTDRQVGNEIVCQSSGKPRFRVK